MGAGKSFYANYFIQNYNYSLFSFAYGMKYIEKLHQDFKQNKLSYDELVNAITDMKCKLDVPSECIGEIVKLAVESDLIMPKNRLFLQTLGTDIVRRYNANAWSNYTIKCIEEYGNKAVIDDVRFTNEAEALSKAGFIVVRLEVENLIRLNKVCELYGPSALSEARQNHISETDLDCYNGFDLVVDNLYKDEYLQENIKKIMQLIE